MSQRNSGYARKERDAYATPRWPVEALFPYLRGEKYKTIWEPACGDGAMTKVFVEAGFNVIATDIMQGVDFLKEKRRDDIDAIVTNPSYNLAQQFIEHSLAIAPPHALIAMLLRTDFAHAKTRQHIFRNCPQFAFKIELLSRIVWFEPATARPSVNHSWFIWKMDNKHKPEMRWEP